MNLRNYRQSQLVRGGLLAVSSILVFVVLWRLGSMAVPRNLPGPMTTFETTLDILEEPGPRRLTGLDHLRISLTRVAIVLAASLVLSVSIGILMGVSRGVERTVRMWLPLWMTSPDVVVILLMMIVIGFDGQAIIIAVTFTATPFGIVNIYSGIKDIDSNLLEMTEAYDSHPRLVWQYLYLPHLMSYIFASTRYLIGLTWKVVLVGETFGTQKGMGAIIRFWFDQGEVEPVLAYLMLFVVIMLLIEYGGFKILERRLFAWRQTE